MTVVEAEIGGERSQSPGLLVVGSFSGSAPLEKCPSGDLAVRLQTRGWRVFSRSREESRLGRPWNIIRTVLRDHSRYDVALADVFSGPAFLWAEAVVLSLRALRKKFVFVLHGGNLSEFARLWPSRVRRPLDEAVAGASPPAYLAEELEPLPRGHPLSPECDRRTAIRSPGVREDEIRTGAARR